MEEDSGSKVTILRRIWRLLQWVVSIAALLAAVGTLLSFREMTVPGTLVEAMWISLGCFALVAACLSPPIFFRLPKPGKIGAYVSLLVAFGVMVHFHDQALEAYYRTPEGAKVAASKAAQKKAEADRRQAQEIVEEEVARNNRFVSKLEACLDEKKEIPTLSEDVKYAMHNPNSFEHVYTKFIEPDAAGRNVVIRFRGTNGFGGVITSEILGRIDADTCSVTDLSKPD